MELPSIIMDPFGSLFASVESISFGILAIVAIFGALGTVYSNRVAHSMLALIMCFFAVAGIFLIAGAEMLAAVQILVYLGSVMLVYAFGVMLSRRQIMEEDFE
ncbi:MAG: NADH-quinone oxidoreductase subunit J [Candidatus Thermoplasmatota archaeon]|nr:short chain dehydrogenase [Euryarchaeota archaeon]MEC9091019.1 NADH-quinone oxidoreductase subunit J [Candidatus Thermoplasmatota archaeon]MED5486275.1 NADH-quinone oxidoreductase subunit J [Candidatus Thermoplasmatota archaeon]